MYTVSTNATIDVSSVKGDPTGARVTLPRDLEAWAEFIRHEADVEGGFEISAASICDGLGMCVVWLGHRGPAGEHNPDEADTANCVTIRCHHTELHHLAKALMAVAEATASTE